MFELRVYNQSKFKKFNYMHMSILRFKSEEHFLKHFKNQPTFLYKYSSKDIDVIGYMVDDTIFELFGKENT